MAETNWEELLQQLNAKVDEERKIWASRLKGKIDELRTFKEEMIKLHNAPTHLLQSREERLKELERKLEQEREYIEKEEHNRKDIEQNLKQAQHRLIQMEKENEYFRAQLTSKTTELNDLRVRMAPHMVKKSMGENDRIKYFEDKLQETEDFYRKISERIDKLLQF